MIVVMAAGLAANLTANPFEAVTTVTVQIVTLLVGDQEFDSAKTLAAFALGLMLFVVTLASTSSPCTSCASTGSSMTRSAIVETTSDVREGRKRGRIAEAPLRRRAHASASTAWAGAIMSASFFLGLFFGDHRRCKGYSAFVQTIIKLEVDLDAGGLDPRGHGDSTSRRGLRRLVRKALREGFSRGHGAPRRREALRLVSIGAGFQLRDMVARRSRADRHHDARPLGSGDDDVDMLIKGNIDPQLDESERPGQRQADRLGRSLEQSGRSSEVQHDLLHRRRLARAGAGRHLGRR